MNQLVSLKHEVVQLLFLLVKVLGICVNAETNTQRRFDDVFRGLRVGRFSVQTLMQFAYHHAHGFCADALGVFFMVGCELVERGLEIAKEHEEFQLGFEALEMEDVAPETGKGLLLKWGSLFAFAHGRSM